MESDEEEGDKVQDESVSIDEWSDGDEKIRAKNKANKEKKKKRDSNESSASSTTTNSTTAGSTNNKRKTEDKGKILVIKVEQKINLLNLWKKKKFIKKNHNKP